MTTCHGCGIEKDLAVPEMYPYLEDNITDERPVQPLLWVDCEDYYAANSPDRRVWVCHHCYHKLQPDMWISRRCWEAIKPVTPFDALPLAPN